MKDKKLVKIQKKKKKKNIWSSFSATSLSLKKISAKLGSTYTAESSQPVEQHILQSMYVTYCNSSKLTEIFYNLNFSLVNIFCKLTEININDEPLIQVLSIINEVLYQNEVLK